MKVVACVVVCALLPAAAAAQSRRSARALPTYTAAEVSRRGHLAITRSDGQTVVVRKTGKQTTFSQPVVSADGSAVAAQANFANCCTSYDIPLQLVVHRNGKTHRFAGAGLAIFQWGFVDGGRRVAFGQETVHFSCFTHYELRDVDSERLIDSADVPQACGQNPDPQPVKIPEWVAAVVNFQRPTSNSPKR